jgi:hypothetical protein
MMLDKFPAGRATDTRTSHRVLQRVVVFADVAASTPDLESPPSLHLPRFEVQELGSHGKNSDAATQ